MKRVQRGKFHTLVRHDDSTVHVVLATKLVKEPRLVSGKTYATIAISRDIAPDIYEVDNSIKTYQPDIAYSPVLSNGRLLVIKLAPNALVDDALTSGEPVEAHLRLGNYGSFGYCWIATNLVRREVSTTPRS